MIFGKKPKSKPSKPYMVPRSFKMPSMPTSGMGKNMSGQPVSSPLMDKMMGKSSDPTITNMSGIGGKGSKQDKYQGKSWTN